MVTYFRFVLGEIKIKEYILYIKCIFVYFYFA